MHMLDVPKSGRSGDVVFFMVRNRQRERAYVIPRNVRNAATGRARGAFGALSKAFSTLLTSEQQQAWTSAAAKVQSRPRLNQCGPLTGQQHYVGINSSRARIDREMLFWPPAPVAFGPNPVEALSLRYADGRLRIELKLSGPVPEDIMVFAQASCSPGRKKWRHGTCLGLLPAPQHGISDITKLYLEAFGEPEPCRNLFIRTRQQRNGWEGEAKDVSELVPVNPLAAQNGSALPPIGFLLSEPCGTRVAVSAADRFPTHPLPVRPPCHRPTHQPCTRGRYHTSAVALPLQYRSAGGDPRTFRTLTPPARLRHLPKPRQTRHCRELWHGG
jgi:hypothetical protein